MTLSNIKSESRHRITGRGTVFVINKTKYKDYKFRIGDRIKIDNELYTIAGIEKRWKLMSPPIPGNLIGILTREYKGD